MKKLLALILLMNSFCLSGCSEKSPDKGIAALDRGDYKTALDELSPLADDGNHTAQLKLGNMYHDGLGVPKNQEKAFQLYQKSALQNNSTAQLKLANAYLMGTGTHKDEKLGFHWMEKSAMQGLVDAQYNLSKLHFDGTGTSKNPKLAFEFAEKAANQGDKGSQLKLCHFYAGGIGTAKNFDKALTWCQEAATAGSAEAQFFTGAIHYEKGNIKFFLEWIEKASMQKLPQALYLEGIYFFKTPYPEGNLQKGLSLLENAAKLGHAEAQNALGQHYMDTHSNETALSWLKLAAAQNIGEAMNSIGVIIATQSTPNYSEAIEWYSKAAENGYLYAYRNLGNMHIRGLGTKKDLSKGIKLLQFAADQGSSDAQRYLGDLYYEGEETKKNHTLAFEWYLKAANLGDAYSQYSVAHMYEHGQGTNKDRELAFSWYVKAAEGGETSAVTSLNSRFKSEITDKESGWNEVKSKAKELCEKLSTSYTVQEICLEQEKAAFLRLANSNTR